MPRGQRPTRLVRLLALGSQAIHVLVEPEDVPEQLTASVELDVVVLDTLPGQSDPAQLIAGAIGEGSDFHVTHGYYPDGMTLDEALLPSGWKGRLRSIDVHRLDYPDAPAKLYAPELADLCASKLAAPDARHGSPPVSSAPTPTATPSTPAGTTPRRRVDDVLTASSSGKHRHETSADL